MMPLKLLQSYSQQGYLQKSTVSASTIHYKTPCNIQQYIIYAENKTAISFVSFCRSLYILVVRINAKVLVIVAIARHPAWNIMKVSRYLNRKRA